MVATRSASKSPTAAAASPAAAAKRPSSADSSKSPASKKQATSPKPKMDFQVGKPATKDVALVNQDGDEVKFLDTFKDHGVVFFMYPRANTPGCTKQACGFRDHIQEIKDAGFTVYGLSADSPKSLLNWKTKEKLSYDLLSDPKHELIKYFGSSIGGTKVQRSHVVILKGGVVGDIQGKVSPAESVERAVAFVTSNKQSSDAAALVAAPEAASKLAAKKEEQKTASTFAVGEKVTLEVELLTHASEKVQVQSLFKERGAIFFMYPKADTPGCTIQACGFNDNIKEINDAGFDVYGLGADTPEELLAWKQKQSYAYSFLSDPKHELIGYFGNSSSEGARVERSHVIVLPGGKIGQIELKVAPKDSFTKALEFVKANAVANLKVRFVLNQPVTKMVAQRELWFLLVNARGESITLADVVDCAADAYIARFRHAVKRGHADSLLAGIAPSELRVFETRAAFGEKQLPLTPGSSLGSHGLPESGALIEQAPEQRVRASFSDTSRSLVHLERLLEHCRARDGARIDA